MKASNDTSDTRPSEGVMRGMSGPFVWIDLGTDHVAVGSSFEFADLARNEKSLVYVVGADPEDLYLVSKKKDRPGKTRQDLRQAWEHKAVIIGKVSSIVKGGFVVDIGAPAFMPTSKSGGRDREEREELVGREVLCTIEEFMENGGDIILNRRVLLEAAELWGQRSALEELKVGSRVRGRVCTLTDFGAFVDLGGIDGLVHVRDISWQYVHKPADILSLGQEVEAVVERVDPRNGRIGLSLKALQSDPWGQVPAKYRVGESVSGKVTAVNSFGAFVELEPGVEGLVHTADLISTTESLPQPLSRGVRGEFYIADVNAAERRIALMLQRTRVDPWQDVEKRFPAGSVVMGRISTLTSFGAFVAVDSGVEGLIHFKDIREGKLNHPGDVLTEGQYIRVQVLECDPIHHKLRLGLKQLAEKPLAISAKSHAPVVGENSNVQVADYMQYSRSVFVNCPTHEPHRAVTEAIVFAILEAAFIPRLAADRDTVVSAVRECQFGIHDVSRTFEMGLFFGCQQYGADLHRMKTALLFHSETRDAVLGEDVYAHLNRPSEALHHVTNWLAKILRTTARPEQVWNHYQQFRTDTERSFLKANTSSQDPALATYIQAVSKWLE